MSYIWFVPIRILVVDDENSSRMILCKLLKKFGDVETASSGQEAYTKFIQAHGELRPFDLVSLDIDMPGMSGSDVLGKMRKWEEVYRCYQTSKTVKVMMVTGDSKSSTVLGAFRKGAEDFVVKPAKAERIHEVMEKLGLDAAA